MFSEVESSVLRHVEIARNHSSDIAVIAVVNVKSQTRRLDDYEGHSVRSSFLSDWEIDDLIGAMRDCGFYVRHFADERDFFLWQFNDGPQGVGRKRVLVYTSALNGTGPGRRTLVPAFCNHFQLETVNSDAYACAINRHKFHCARLLESFGIPVPNTWSYHWKDGWWDGQRPELDEKVIAKSTYEGSSLGVEAPSVGPFSLAMEEHFCALSRQLRQPLTIQSLIEGMEVEVPLITDSRPTAMGIAALQIDASAVLGSRVLSYEDAYEDAFSYTDGIKLLPHSQTELIRTIAERSARVLNFKGLSRIDFRINDRGEAFVTDVSSTPHLTKSNAVAFVMAQAGYEYRDVFHLLVGLTFL